MEKEHIAMVCHELFRAYILDNNKISIPSWNNKDCADSTKEGMIYMVNDMLENRVDFSIYTDIMTKEKPYTDLPEAQRKLYGTVILLVNELRDL